MTPRGIDNDGNPSSDADEYVSFGYLDPLLGRRIMQRLSHDHVRFVARDATTFDVITAGILEQVSYRYPYPRLARINRIELLVHREDQNLARKIIEET
jgi:hypothetical protein